MSTGGLIEKGAVALVHRAAGLTMALAPARKEQVQTVARVVAVRDLGTATRRLTIAADTLRTFERSGPDEYVGLLMPERGARLVMPADRPDPRAAVAAMPEGERPALRWYTIRAHRPEAGEIDVDVVRHGDSGPGSAWACRVGVGDEVGVRSAGSVYAGWRPGDAAAVDRVQLLVADETALPAVCAIQEWLGNGPGRPVSLVHVEVPSVETVGVESIPAGALVHERGDAAPGSAVLDVLAQEPIPGLGYAWICGEGSMVAAARRHVMRGQGLDRWRISDSGYWRLGRPRP